MHCWASCPVTHGGCRQSAACYWAWCPAMHQVSADSTLLGIMPSNAPHPLTARSGIMPSSVWGLQAECSIFLLPGHHAQQCTRSTDSTFLGIMPRNGPVHILFWCKMTHYFKCLSFSAQISKSECYELVRLPFNIHIFVDVEVKTLTDENTHVFLTPCRFWLPYWTSLWEEICNVKRSKDSVRKK